MLDSTQYHPLGHYLDRLPGHRKNSKPHKSTLTRWCTVGLPVPGGRLRLRAARIGNRWVTTDEWFDQFVAALTAAHVGNVPVAPEVAGE